MINQEMRERGIKVVIFGFIFVTALIFIAVFTWSSQDERCGLRYRCIDMLKAFNEEGYLLKTPNLTSRDINKIRRYSAWFEAASNRFDADDDARLITALSAIVVECAATIEINKKLAYIRLNTIRGTYIPQ